MSQQASTKCYMPWKQLAATALPGLQALCKLFGYKPGELTDKNVNSLMPPPFSQQHNAILARYKATGKGVLIGTGEAVTGPAAALHWHVCNMTATSLFRTAVSAECALLKRHGTFCG